MTHLLRLPAARAKRFLNCLRTRFSPKSRIGGLQEMIAPANTQCRHLLVLVIIQLTVVLCATEALGRMLDQSQRTGPEPEFLAAPSIFDWRQFRELFNWL